MPPLDRSNPRKPERDEGPAEVEGLSDNEALSVRGMRALRGPDELHCRWAPWDDGRGRGWVACTDPFTGEEVQVPTKYLVRDDGGPPPWHDPRYTGNLPEGVTAEPAPQTFVWRAMDAKDREKLRQGTWRQREAPRRPARSPDYDPEESP